MAATKLATREKRVGSVLKQELWTHEGYSRKEVTVTVAAGMDVGSVLYLSAGKYLHVDVANTANASAVLIDDNIDTDTVGDQTLVVLVRTGVVNGANLLYAADVDDQAKRDAVNAVLDAAGIMVAVGQPNIA